MELINKNRLEHIIEKRRQNMSSIIDFGYRFNDLKNEILPEIIDLINQELRHGTNDLLKIFYDDPYNKRTARHYILVQLFSSNQDIDFLDGTANNPSLKFEGNEFSGKIVISYKLRNDASFKKQTEVFMDSFWGTAIEDVLLEFIENAYSE